MRPRTKDHLSDGEEDDIKNEEVQVTKPSKDEIERQRIHDLPVIADSEISPAAYLFQNQEEHDELNLFESESTKVKCPFCDAVSYSIVEYRTSLLGYLVAIFSILLFGFLSIILMPFLVSLTKQALHRCAKCLNEVKSNSFFGFSSLEDKIISLNLGKFGIILTRRYLLYIVVTISVSLLLYLYVLNEAGHDHEARRISSYDWLTFRAECGWGAYNLSPQRAMQLFDRKYYNQGISWDGYIIRVNMNDEDTLNYAYHSTSIMIKMVPPDQNFNTGPDLGLSLSEHALSKLKDELDKLHRGDHVRFNATLLSMGDNHHLHHLHAFDIQKIEGHMDVEAHVHNTGRYKFKQAAHDHPEETGGETKIEEKPIQRDQDHD